MSDTDVSSSLSVDWLAELQRRGYRLSRPLQIIVQLLAESNRALDPLELYDRGRQLYPPLGLVTVYRTLEKLEALGLIQRLHLQNHCNRYLRAAQGHEHVLICTSCGRTVFFEGDDLSRLMAITAQQSGFTIHDHWLQLFGLCSACQENPEDCE